MRIKEVAKQTGLTERTIRYYESVGLVIPNMEERNWRLWREYSPEHVRLLSAVATLRRASFRVEEISLLLTEPEKIPETVETVRKRAEEARTEAERLCARLSQPDLREAADVPDLARRLEAAASGSELPPADRNYDYRSWERKVPEPRSLSASLAVRIGVLACILWLLSMVLLTCFYAKDLGNQAAQVSEEALEAFFDGVDTAASLPDVTFRPASGILTGNGAEFPLAKAVLILDEKGVVVGSRGFRMPEPTSDSEIRELVSKHAQPTYTMLNDRLMLLEWSLPEMGLSVWEGKLSLLAVQASTSAWQPTRFSLSFQDAPKWGGSFPAHEIDGNYPDKQTRYKYGFPVPGERHDPALDLLDGIEEGTLCFDADGVFQGSRLRGVWLRSGEGEKACFLLAAYGWSPLAMAFRLLPGAYLVSLAVCLLLGALLWLGLRRCLVRPLKAWDAALRETLLDASPAEFDYTFRYRELRDLAGHYLLRRAMLEASAEQPPEGSADLTGAMETARRKLLPLLLDRGLSPKTDYRAQGTAAAAPEKLEEALLALLREVLPCGDQGSELKLRTLEKEGFLLAEAEAESRKKLLRAGSYAALWEGVYRLPVGGDAPGARLRRAAAAIPGSFVAVRKTEHGLCLTLGLPPVSRPLSGPDA